MFLSLATFLSIYSSIKKERKRYDDATALASLWNAKEMEDDDAKNAPSKKIFKKSVLRRYSCNTKAKRVLSNDKVVVMCGLCRPRTHRMISAVTKKVKSF